MLPGGAVITAARAAERRGRAFLCYLPGHAAGEVERLFEATGLDAILPVCRSWGDLVAALDAAA